MTNHNNKMISFRKILQASGRPIKTIANISVPIKRQVQQTPKPIRTQPPQPQIQIHNVQNQKQMPRVMPQPAVIKPHSPLKVSKSGVMQNNYGVRFPQDQMMERIKTIKDIGINRILIIIAAGPSVNEIDLTPLKDKEPIDLMCINKPYRSVWPTKFWAFCDHTQYIRNQEDWNTYQGLIINSPNVTIRKSSPNQIVIKAKAGKGFSKDLTTGYHIGRSSTYANMQTAIYMNYSKIYIFGLDMCEVNGVLYHYGANPDVAPENRKPRFAAEAESYMWAAQNLPDEIKNRFIFCSNYNTWKFIDHFPKLDHIIAVSEILKLI